MNGYNNGFRIQLFLQRGGGGTLMEIRILLIIFQMKERREKQPQEVKDKAILGGRVDY